MLFNNVKYFNNKMHSIYYVTNLNAITDLLNKQKAQLKFNVN